MPARAETISGIVLAAGASTRLGRPKQLLPLDGRPLLQHVLEAAEASSLTEVVLVLGAAADVIAASLPLSTCLKTRIVVNPDFASGQASSLRVGLGAADAQSQAAAVLLGDQPGVGAALIDRVIAAFARAESPIVRPAYDGPSGRVPGHPVVIARELWVEAQRLRADSGLRGLIARHPEWLLEVPIEGEAPGDIDTENDYRRLLRAAATRSAG